MDRMSNNTTVLPPLFPEQTCKMNDFMSQADACLFIFISLAAIIGNLIVFICYYKYRPLRRITNVYILSLSASDLLVASLSVPYTFVIFVCKLQPQIAESELQSMFYLVCDMVPSILSIYALALVAVDRAIAISKPFWHRKYVNNRRASIIVFLMWIYVFGLVSCVFIIAPSEFTLFIIMTAYVLPVAMMVFSYVLMGFVAKKHAKELSSLERTKTRLRAGSVCNGSADNSISTNGTESPFLTPHSYRRVSDNGASPLMSNNRRMVTYQEKHLGDRFQHRQYSWFRSSVRRFSVANIRNRSSSIVSSVRVLKRELKAALTLSLILGCFILSWTPFIGLNIEYYRCSTCYIDPLLIKYFKMLHFTNSALNPVLFILLNKRWRSAFFIVIMRRKNRRGLSITSEISTTSTIGGTGW
ncbi:5-hydroxytryptamine receptor 1D-like [Clytia hemisphaerica]|uniref:5-hydroxytryptamine receptor 1D-like n=1 Tax=Clytia hemisphaerica TaxID=252671 RepID=UPI0034D44EBA